MVEAFDSPIPTPVSAGPKPSVRLHCSVCTRRPVASVCLQGRCQPFRWVSFCQVRKGSIPGSCSLNDSSSSLWQPDCPFISKCFLGQVAPPWVEAYREGSQVSPDLAGLWTPWAWGGGSRRGGLLGSGWL